MSNDSLEHRNFHLGRRAFYWSTGLGIAALTITFLAWQFPRAPKNEGQLSSAKTTEQKEIQKPETRAHGKPVEHVQVSSVENPSEILGPGIHRSLAQTDSSTSQRAAQVQPGKAAMYLQQQAAEIPALTKLYAVTLSTSPIIITARTGNSTSLTFRLHLTNASGDALLPFLGGQSMESGVLGTDSRIVAATGEVCSLSLAGGGLQLFGTVNDVKDRLAGTWSGVQLEPGQGVDVVLTSRCPLYLQEADPVAANFRISFADPSLLGRTEKPYRTMNFSAMGLPLVVGR